jgi:hypothetical protein
MNEPIVYMATKYGLEKLRVIKRIDNQSLWVKDKFQIEFKVYEENIFTDLKEAYTWMRKYLRRKLHDAKLQVSTAKQDLHNLYAKYKERIRELDKSNR